MDMKQKIEENLYVLEAQHKVPEAEDINSFTEIIYTQMIDDISGTGGAIDVLLLQVNVSSKSYIANMFVLSEALDRTEELISYLEEEALKLELMLTSIDEAMLNTTDPNIIGLLAAAYTTVEGYLIDIKDVSVTGDIVGGYLKRAMDKKVEIEDLIYTVEAEHLIVEGSDIRDAAAVNFYDKMYGTVTELSDFLIAVRDHTEFFFDLHVYIEEPTGSVKWCLDQIDLDNKGYYENMRYLDMARDLLDELEQDLNVSVSELNDLVVRLNIILPDVVDPIAVAAINNAIFEVQVLIDYLKQVNNSGDVIGGLMLEVLNTIDIVEDKLAILKAEHFELDAVDIEVKAQALYSTMVDDVTFTQGQVDVLLNQIDIGGKTYYQNGRLLDKAKDLLDDLLLDLNVAADKITDMIDTIDIMIANAVDPAIISSLTAIRAAVKTDLDKIRELDGIGDLIGGYVLGAQDRLQDVQDKYYELIAGHLEIDAENEKVAAFGIYSTVSADVQALIDLLTLSVGDYYKDMNLLDQADELLTAIEIDLNVIADRITGMYTTVDAIIADPNVDATIKTNVLIPARAAIEVDRDEVRTGVPATAGWVKDTIDKINEVKKAYIQQLKIRLPR